MAGLRAAQKEMTRRLLLTTALEVFEAKGYAASTVDDIAAAAGTTRVTFYAYFPSRSDLMRALIGELNDILERSDSPERGSTASALVDAVRAGTRSAIEAWLLESSSQWDVIRPYITATVHAAAVDPELRELVDGWFEEAIADIRAGLDQADRFDPDTRHLRGVLAMSQLDYAARHWEQGRWGVDRDRVVEALAESWTNLLTDAGDRSGR